MLLEYEYTCVAFGLISRMLLFVIFISYFDHLFLLHDDNTIYMQKTTLSSLLYMNSSILTIGLIKLSNFEVRIHAKTRLQ
jgi:hypothetical protein